MKKLTLALSLLVAVSAFAIGLPDTGGGEDIDTSKADELIANIDEIVTKFDTATAQLDAARETINTVCAAHGIEDVLADPAATAGIAGELTDEEKTSLQEAVETIADVPATLTSLGTDIPAVVEGIPNVITDLVAQIQKNPMKAGGLKDLQSKLTEGQEKLGEIGPAATETTTAATELTTTLSSLLQ